jgi:hypothetical protein
MLSLNGLSKTVLSSVILIASIGASYSAATAFWPKTRLLHRTDIRSSTPQGEPVNPFASSNGTNLVVYVFTASDCGWSVLLGQGEAVRSLRTQLRSVHGSAYAQITIVGVGLDRDVGTGLRFLTDLGDGSISNAFDQVVVGGSWLNEQIIRLVWREGVIEPALPQILVVERPVDTASYVETHKIEVQHDRVVANLRGERQITQWMDAGYPVGRTETVTPAPSPSK